MLTAMFRTVYDITKGRLLKRDTLLQNALHHVPACPTYISLFDSFMQHGAKEHKRPNNIVDQGMMYLVSLFFCVMKQSITIYIAAFHVTSFFCIEFFYKSYVIDRSYSFIDVTQKMRGCQKVIDLIKFF